MTTFPPNNSQNSQKKRKKRRFQIPKTLSDQNYSPKKKRKTKTTAQNRESTKNLTKTLKIKHPLPKSKLFAEFLEETHQ